MTEANEANGTDLEEHDDETDVDEDEGEFALASADIPPSLMRYFEASRSRAAACEKLMLEAGGENCSPGSSCCAAFMAPSNRPVVSSPFTTWDEDEPSVRPNEQNLQDSGESDTDGGLRTQAPGTGAASPSGEEEEMKEISEHQQEPNEKRRFEEQIRRRENDFQAELNQLMEAEKLHQMELELMEKEAQQQLEQELLLQQELISNLQKQVMKERRMMAEELKRMKEEEEKRRKEEEDKKKMKEEKIRREKQRMEEERQNQKMLEIGAEEEKRIKEEKRKEEEEEERRKKEEVKFNMEAEKRKREEEDKKKMKEEKIRREKQQMEEERQNQKMLEIRAEEEKRIKEEKRKEEEEEERRKKEEVKINMEAEKRKREEEDKKKWEEEEMKRDVQRRKMEEEMKRKREEEKGKKDKETKTNERNKTIREREDKKSEMEREMKDKKMENKSNEKRQEEEAGMKVTGTKIDGSIKKKHEDNLRHMEEQREEEGKAALTENERREAEVTKELEARTRQQEKRKEKKTEEERRDDGKMQDEQMGEGDEGKPRLDGKQSRVMRKEEEAQEQQERKRDEEQKEGIRPEEEGDGKAKTRKGDTEIMGEGGRELERRTLESGDEGMKEEVSENEEGNLKAEEEEGRTESREQREQMSRKHHLQGRKEANNGGNGGAGPWLEDARSCSAQHQQLPAEQKRLCWMKGCVSWCKLSLHNRRKPRGPPRGGGRPRRPAEAGGPPPLCPDALLQATGRGSFQEVTAVALEDLPGSNLSTLGLCCQLQSLTLRRCGLRALEGVSHLSQLCYIDVTENDIAFVDCENMSSLRVLRLGYNKLTSIHGLRGADNLDVLELSHNSITRIAGLESMRRLQRLSVDHNQLISTKGLRDVYTLLHLNCSHNHLASVEGLENSALLSSLDLRSNTLSEPPSLDNHVLLTELRLDDNSVSSLQGLAACWLPLLQHLSVAQNRITRLPSMSDFVSLANLDLRFNCMSELQNVCESLEGCVFLQSVQLAGNPLQLESGWRSTLQNALPGLRAIDHQDTGCALSPPAVQHLGLASESFLTLCQAQLQQMNDLQQQHSRELSKASSSLDAVKSLCRRFTETLELAEAQRFAHEYGDVAAPEGQAVLEGPATEAAPVESSQTAPVSPSGNNSYWTFEKSPTQSWLQSVDTVPKLRESGLANRTTSSHLETAALSNLDLDLKSTAAVVIQQQWRKYRQKHGDVSRRPLAASEGDGANPEPGLFCNNHSAEARHYAATVIQASWRGSSVRRRLASALAAVTFPGTREDDTFEEVDLDGFVFDEAELEKQWTLPLSEDWFSRRDPVSEQPPPPEFPGPLPQPSHYAHAPHAERRPRQAWAAEEEPGAAGRVSPETSRGKSPSSSVLSGISGRSEKILEEWGFTDSHTALQMLKRAQNMKQQHKKKHRDPSGRLALFPNCNYQLVPAEARSSSAPHSRTSKAALRRAELEAQQAQRTDAVKQESAQQRQQVQADGNRDHFLPELSSDILRGGRVQLVVDPLYSERHRASGLRANSSFPPGTSLKNVTRSTCTDVPAAPSVKERISFRDNPVQLSGGWGGGKKRNK